MRELNNARLAELDQISARAGGLLIPLHVVEFARDPNTALHSAFEWDDSAAAHKYRIEQARELIRVMVTVQAVGDRDVVIRPYISLIQDRRAGGYRATADVMADPELRSRMLDTALLELRRFRNRYKHFQELAALFSAIDIVLEFKENEVVAT